MTAYQQITRLLIGNKNEIFSQAHQQFEAQALLVLCVSKSPCSIWNTSHQKRKNHRIRSHYDTELRERSHACCSQDPSAHTNNPLTQLNLTPNSNSKLKLNHDNNIKLINIKQCWALPLSTNSFPYAYRFPIRCIAKSDTKNLINCLQQLISMKNNNYSIILPKNLYKINIKRSVYYLQLQVIAQVLPVTSQYGIRTLECEF